MVSYLYKPECPFANKEGMVTKDEWYYYKFMTIESKQMMNGNTPVELRFISDTMQETRHMANGKYYTSKHKFRQATKDAGCIEIGNENPIKQKQYISTTSRQKLREDIRQGIRSLKEETLPPQELHTVREIGKQVDYQNRNRSRKKYK